MVELVSDHEEVTVTLEDIPAEASVAIGLGGGSDHRVRILACDERPADSMPLQEKQLRELWDPFNAVRPLCTNAAQRMGGGASDGKSQQQVVHEAMIEEAARLGADVQAEQAAGAAIDR